MVLTVKSDRRLGNPALVRDFEPTSAHGMKDTVEDIFIFRTEAVTENDRLQRLSLGAGEMSEIPNSGKHFIKGDALVEGLGRHHGGYHLSSILLVSPLNLPFTAIAFPI